MSEDGSRFYALIHPQGLRGSVRAKKMRMRKQDRRFKPEEFFLAVFFPKITNLGRASIWGLHTMNTLSETPEMAKAKFMEGKDRAEDETWERYEDAGWR